MSAMNVAASQLYANMHLYLSGRSPLNSIFTNESGQVLYKVSSQIKFPARTSTITRIVPNDSPEDMRDKFVHLAQVQHNVVTSAVLRFGGNEIKVKDYFQERGFSAFGK